MPNGVKGTVLNVHCAGSQSFEACNEGLASAAYVNFSRHSVHFYPPAAISNVRPQRMFALFLDDDGNIRPDFSGDGFGGKAKIGVGRHENLHRPRDRFEIPVTMIAGITVDFEFARYVVSFHVEFGAIDID